MKKYFSPGRINLIGEHIDYNGGNVFPCAIDLGVSGYVNLNNSNFINLKSKNIGSDQTISVDYTMPYTKTNTWADYMIGVLDTLRNHGFENKIGFDLEINSNLPYGAGLSSSACIEVLMCVILNDLNNFNLNQTQIALFAKEAENNFVGVNCGIMDQFIIANGKSNHALLLNTNTLEFKHIPINLGDYKILILNSNKKRGLVDSEYNTRREECQNAKQIINIKYGVDNLCDISTIQLEEIKNQFAENVYKRAYHAVSEQERVQASMVSLQNNDIDQFAKYVTSTHYSLRDNFEVSCNELDYIVDKSLALGALGARMIGAGFGGCAIAIVKESNIEQFKNELIDSYKNKFDLTCDIYDVNIVDKCMEV